MPDSHKERSTPARGVKDISNQSTILWLTVCTQGHQPWLANKFNYELLQEIWHTQATAWMVGDFLLMPNHLHCFCVPGAPSKAVEKWVSFWKCSFTKKAKPDAGSWQRGVFHHRIRSANEYSTKWTYMMANPVRKGLVKNADD